MYFDAEYLRTLKHTVKITRRTGYTTTAMGQRRSTGETVITAAASCYFEALNGKLMKMPSGDFVAQDFRLFLPFNQDIQEGDWVYPVVGPTGFTYCEALYVQPIRDFDGNTHHIEIGLIKVA